MAQVDRHTGRPLGDAFQVEKDLTVSERLERFLECDVEIQRLDRIGSGTEQNEALYGTAQEMADARADLIASAAEFVRDLSPEAVKQAQERGEISKDHFTRIRALQSLHGMDKAGPDHGRDQDLGNER